MPGTCEVRCAGIKDCVGFISRGVLLTCSEVDFRARASNRNFPSGADRVGVSVGVVIVTQGLFDNVVTDSQEGLGRKVVLWKLKLVWCEKCGSFLRLRSEWAVRVKEAMLV